MKNEKKTWDSSFIYSVNETKIYVKNHKIGNKEIEYETNVS